MRLSVIRRHGLQIGLVVCFWSSMAWATNPPEPVDVQKTIEIAPVVVTPARREQSPDDVDRSVSLVDEDRVLEGQGQSVPDLLEESTGVFVQRTNRGAGSHPHLDHDQVIQGSVLQENQRIIFSNKHH